MNRLTIRHLVEGGDKEVVADNSEPDEHVDGKKDVHQDPAVAPGVGWEDGAGELEDGRLYAGGGAHVVRRQHLHPGHHLRHRRRHTLNILLHLTAASLLR